MMTQLERERWLIPDSQSLVNRSREEEKNKMKFDKITETTTYIMEFQVFVTDSGLKAHQTFSLGQWVTGHDHQILV
jgi:hypothetical protein